MSIVLQGIRVVDVTHNQAGPACMVGLLSYEPALTLLHMVAASQAARLLRLPDGIPLTIYERLLMAVRCAPPRNSEIDDIPKLWEANS